MHQKDKKSLPNGRQRRFRRRPKGAARRGLSSSVWWGFHMFLVHFRGPARPPRAQQGFLFKVLPLITELSASKKVLMGQTFNSSSLSTMLFPLPPQKEQIAIEEKVESLMQKCQILEEEINNSEKNAQMLMQAVLKEAFEGKK